MDKNNTIKTIRIISSVLYAIPWLINIAVLIYLTKFPNMKHFEPEVFVFDIIKSIIVCAVFSFTFYVAFRSPIKLIDRFMLLLNILVIAGIFLIICTGEFRNMQGFMILATIVSVVIVSYSLLIAIKVLKT